MSVEKVLKVLSNIDNEHTRNAIRQLCEALEDANSKIKKLEDDIRYLNSYLRK